MNYPTSKGTILLTKFGSHLYGTDGPNSDQDYKAIELVPLRDLILGRGYKARSTSTGPRDGKNNAGDEDYEAYSLGYFLKLACEGQTVALDMLFTTWDMTITRSRVWDELVANRHRFLTKNMQAFVGYAQRQAAKYGIKGSRLAAVRRVRQVLLEYNPEIRLETFWDKLPRGEHINETLCEKNSVRMYEVCGKKFQETTAAMHVNSALLKYEQQYGARAEQAAENKGIDWKAVSHALRAADQVKQILTTGEIVFPLEIAGYLKEVKAGERDYLSDVAPTLEKWVDEAKALAEASDLPEEADKEWADQFLVEVYANKYYLGVMD